MTTLPRLSLRPRHLIGSGPTVCWVALRVSSGELRCETPSRDVSATPTSLDMHKAILRLAKLRGETGVRLVTTNFDTLFEQASSAWHFGRDLHSGPILPIPRNDKAATWRSVVYLHGRLDEAGANEHLVMTSADFGRSYLTDAWAARFVARLFSDFTVLFIGYSLNDPVLRYMTDAFAAENSSSRVAAKRSPAYIFVPHKGKVMAMVRPIATAISGRFSTEKPRTIGIFGIRSSGGPMPGKTTLKHDRSDRSNCPEAPVNHQPK